MWRRGNSLLPAGLAGLVLLFAASCGGDGVPPVDRAPGVTDPDAAPAAEEVEQTLSRFAEAAGRGDGAAMWDELSAETQAAWGPDRDRFGEGVAFELEEGVGSYARAGFEVVLAEVVDDVAVAALAAEREVEGTTERSAYGAALVREAGEWRLSLVGGPTVTPEHPRQGETVAPDELVVRVEPADAEARIWLEGRELAVRDEGAGRAVASAGELDPGPRVAVALARNGEGATAVAWVFHVPG